MTQLPLCRVSAALLALASTSTAQCPSDDAFEPNDVCAAAVPIGAGLHPGLVVGDTDPDHYTIDVEPGQRLSVDLTFALSSVEGTVWMYEDAACTNLVSATSFDGSSYTGDWTNATRSTVTLRLRCELDFFETGCRTYSLQLGLATDPCLDPASEDAFEDGDTCATAAPLADGTYTDRFVSKYDRDVYAIRLAPGGSLDATLECEPADGLVVMSLYDDAPGTCMDAAFRVETADGPQAIKSLSHTNTTGGEVTYYLDVELWAQHYEDCNTYDLHLVTTGGVDGVPTCLGDGSHDDGAGPVACPCGNESTTGAGAGCRNSLGVGATLAATGTSVVAADDLALHVAGARPGQPAVLIQGATRIATPFRGGILCTGSPTERVEVLTLDAAGAASTTSSLVTEGNVSVGQTRHYQVWYRDPASGACLAGSNLSSGVSVVWR